jgi:hypothetical protein
MKLDVEVIRDLGHAYLPHVYDEISLSPSLEGHHVQSLQSLPVAEVLEATYLRGECSLERFYGFDVLDLCWAPNRATLL